MKKLVKIVAASVLTLSLFSGSVSAMTMYNQPPFEAYKVSKGDTFWFIAKRYGLNYQELMRLNPNVNPYNMQVGSIIRLKSASYSNTTASTSVSVGSMTVSSYEKQVVDLVNQERARAGLPSLKLNAELSRVARYKSQDMRDRRYFDHNSPTYGSPFTMMRNFGISYRSAGENIAYGQRTPQEVVNAWMNSAGHRANILNSSFTDIGVGYVADGNYWTQMFIGR
ncbi:CAP domain-containing protein [Bacillus litorisediminis]|uniref:CAP domain-containing protein n=1 Tax=Bacillus litorisediminis TaxID=2922713 RepID=UPI001FAC0EDE|nr:CAP domain-containing protein [Bacillus litorisediminis]